MVEKITDRDLYELCKNGGTCMPGYKLYNYVGCGITCFSGMLQLPSVHNKCGVMCELGSGGVSVIAKFITGIRGSPCTLWQPCCAERILCYKLSVVGTKLAAASRIGGKDMRCQRSLQYTKCVCTPKKRRMLRVPPQVVRATTAFVGDKRIYIGRADAARERVCLTLTCR